MAFVYGGILGCSCVFVWAYYPETKGRTFGEIERLFEMGVPPRKFKNTFLEDDVVVDKKNRDSRITDNRDSRISQ